MSLLVAATLLSPGAEPLDDATREKCLTVLREALSSDQFWPAMHAAEALSQNERGEEVLKALAKRTPEGEKQRCGLARESVRAGEKAKVETLFAVLADLKSDGRIHAAESLFKISMIGDGTSLRAALTDSEPRLQLMAAAALARSGDTTARSIPRKHLGHADKTARMIAAWVLGQTGTADDIPAIRASVPADATILGKAFVSQAMARLGDAEAIKQLGQDLGSKDAEVRAYTAEAVGATKATQHQPALVKLLDDENLDVRVRAAQSLLLLAK